MTGRVIAAWPSFSLIAAYELLMRQVRRAAETAAPRRRSGRSPGPAASVSAVSANDPVKTDLPTYRRGTAGQCVRLEAWRWAQDNRAEDGSLPSGKDIGIQYRRHERWGRLVKRSGLAGELGT
jgi:hypothetical protein